MNKLFVFIFCLMSLWGVMLSSAHAASRYVDVAGGCGGSVPCTTTVSSAMSAANVGDIIYIFPGIYNESVDLTTMNTPGDISLITVNTYGVQEAGTATIRNTTIGVGALMCKGPFTGNITVNGLNLESDVANTGNDNENGLVFQEITGDISLTDVTASSTSWDAIGLYMINGNISLTRCQGNDSYDDGISIDESTGSVEVDQCVANSNGENGFQIDEVLGTVRLNGCTLNDNTGDGLQAKCLRGNTSVIDSDVVSNNAMGIEILDCSTLPIGNIKINCTEFVGNGGGLHVNENLIVDGINNWWGNSSGPTHSNNPGGSGDSIEDSAAGLSGTVNYSPWLNDPVIHGDCPPSSILDYPFWIFIPRE